VISVQNSGFDCGKEIDAINSEQSQVFYGWSEGEERVGGSGSNRIKGLKKIGWFLNQKDKA
jgi:hypothetical protein